jgi:hypothetical protein
MHFAAFVAGGYIPFIRHSLLEHLNNTIFFCLLLSRASFCISSYCHAHPSALSFCHHSIVLSHNRSTPHNVPKTILYNETDTECATKYMPH